MRVVCLTTNGPHEASTRYRVLQYAPALRAAGHSLRVHAFYRESGGHSAAYVVKAYARQILAMFEDADVVLVHRFAFPFADQLLRLCTKPIVYDFDDAVWLDGEGRERRDTCPLRSHPATATRLATRVLAGNAYLAEWARRYCDDVVLVPTVVDLEQWSLPSRARGREALSGWIGSPTTFKYVSPLLPLLPRPLRIVGAAEKIAGVEQPAWTVDDEPRLFRDLDIGVYPLWDDAWARGKCGLKALQYMASGVASVMSPVGVVPEIAGDTTLYARTDADWKKHTRALKEDVAMRAELAARGRARVAATLTLQRYAPLFVDAVTRTA